MKRTKARISGYLETVERRVYDSLTVMYTPHETAASFAFAIFLAVLPTFGLAPLIAIGFAAFTRRLNQYAMIAAFVIFNPVILSGIYTLSFFIGNMLNPLFPVYQYELPILNQLYLFTRTMLLGTLVLNILFSTTGYVLMRRFVHNYREANPPEPWNTPAFRSKYPMK